MRFLGISTLLSFATIVALGACGEFQSPHFFNGSDALGPIASSDAVTVFSDVGRIALPCTIVPHGTTLSYDDEGRFVVKGAYSLGPYAQFVVQDSADDVVFLWKLQGTLPLGLSFDEKSGVLEGVAAELGQSTVSITAESPVIDEFGTCYRCDPIQVLIEIGPPCTTDQDCRIDDMPSLTLGCNDDAFAELVGGVCTYGVEKATSCPARLDRFQVRLDSEKPLDAQRGVEFSGVVHAHELCSDSAFSWDDGGHSGHCIAIQPDEGSPFLTELEGTQLVRIAYRLPWNYPAPVEVGQRYAFHFERSPGWEDAHFADGSLAVFALRDNGDILLHDVARTDRDLVFAGHTGRMLPNDFFRECQRHGVCPFVPRAEMAPTLCPAVSSSTCGHRTPVALFVEDESGEVQSILPEERPAMLALRNRESERVEVASPFALHMGMSDSFVGDEAIDCLDADDRYRLSYFAVPSNACVFLHAGPVDDHTTATAPTRLAVEVENAFSPAGRSLEFVGHIVEQPATNEIFVRSEPLLSASKTLDFLALVPGIYTFRVEPDDGFGTPSCGERESVQFAVEPRDGALVYLELSQRERAELRLLIAPEELRREAYLGGDGNELVASKDNPSPAWVFSGSSSRGSTMRWESPNIARVPGAGVVSFNADRLSAGRYRVVVYRPEESGEQYAGLDWQPAHAVKASLRAILDHNLETTETFSASLADCEMWEVGILEVTATEMQLIPSEQDPLGLCTQDEDEGDSDVPFDLP